MRKLKQRGDQVIPQVSSGKMVEEGLEIEAQGGIKVDFKTLNC